MKKVISIPKDRIAVLIGSEGTDRKKIERLGKVKLWIESDSGEVTVMGKKADQVYLAEKVVKLIGRGFSPDSACGIFRHRYVSEILSVGDFGLKKNKDKRRILARVIGTKGKAKRFIEHKTNTEIVIYGKTVGILGRPNNVLRAKQVVESILNGASYGSAYRFLEDN